VRKKRIPKHDPMERDMCTLRFLATTDVPKPMRVKLFPIELVEMDTSSFSMGDCPSKKIAVLDSELKETLPDNF